MTLYTALSDVPAGYGPSVVTIGNFDGVHRGHARVISRVVSLAEEHGLRSIAVSFDPHPIQVHRPEVAHHDIMSQGARRHYMCLLGLEDYLLLHYSLEFAQQTPEEFVKTTFVDGLNARYVVIGDDVRFGRNNSGDLNTMRELGEKYGFEVVVVEDLMVDENTRCSSTRIRELLLEGDMPAATELLGRHHMMAGEVVHGLARGRELGFPTANLSEDVEGVIPADGVYAGWVVRAVPGTQSAEFLPAAISVGTNPQFNGEERTVEAHVLGRSDLNLYGERIAVTFVSRIRPMMSFDSLDGLLTQMDDDLRQTASVLGIGVAGRVDPWLSIC